MNHDALVTTKHRARKAYIYIRQSTQRQVLENQESTRLQYDLRLRALALGWSEQDIVVIDEDQGKSGASSNARTGFQRLFTEVGLGNVGIVMGLEVSRLARKNSDWHRLIEVCDSTNTLLLDNDAIYDLSDFNNRLVLGIKGTISEAELHILKSRMLGGLRAKAKRGELKGPIPVGFVYDRDRLVILDPDSQVQATIRLLFSTFDRTGSAFAVVQYFHKENLKFPSRLSDSRRNENLLTWKPLRLSRVTDVLHNPRYAGAYFFGASRQSRNPDGSLRSIPLPRHEWTSFIENAHDGYITLERFDANQAKLLQNFRLSGIADRPGATREGPALLQGIAYCGICGKRMIVQYGRYQDRQESRYICLREKTESASPICQSIKGPPIEAAISALMIELIEPRALELAIAIQHEMETKVDDVARLHRSTLTRVQYQTQLAEKRFLNVDPENRLVAATLEREWNERLREEQEALREYDAYRLRAAAKLEAETARRVLEISRNFPRIWNDPQTPDRERKRMIRLLIEDVTLLKDAHSIQVRFHSEATRTITYQIENRRVARKTDRQKSPAQSQN